MSKIEQMMNFRYQNSMKKKVVAFLLLSKVIQDFGSIATLLADLANKDALNIARWTEVYDDAFNALKAEFKYRCSKPRKCS